MSEGPYTVCATSKDTDPYVYGVSGPGRGLGYHAWYAYPENTFATHEDAEKAARLMNIAFEEGRKAKAAEIRGALLCTG